MSTPPRTEDRKDPLSEICSCMWDGPERTQGIDCPVHKVTRKPTLDECRKAGHWIDWVDCWNGCDEGWHTDLHEMDPMWYDEGDMEKCDVCNGHGGWQLCFTCHPEAADEH